MYIVTDAVHSSPNKMMLYIPDPKIRKTEYVYLSCIGLPESRITDNSLIILLFS